MVDTAEPEAVALVGVAFEFPGCDDWESLTELLRAGRDVMRQIPDARADSTGVARSTGERGAGWIDDITGFDYRYFGLSRAEAELIDPRQRRMLQLAVRAIGDAGYAPVELAGANVAVLSADYGGPRASLFDLLSQSDQRTALAETGSLHAYLAGRIAFHLDLRGTAEVIDTACSSFLVALHEARWKLARGECDAALVGGYELALGDSAQRSTDVDGLGLLSPVGRCRPFDAEADGFATGEGGGFVLVKRLADALRDGDCVRAVIRGSATNQDASRTTGLTAPSPSAQTEVISAAWREAGVSAASIGYIEAHGTGTKIGDPLEVQGLAGALSTSHEPSSVPWLSSVKANFGHLGGMAAFAGLMRILAQFRGGEIFPTAGFRQPNPLLALDGVPLRIADRVVAWPAGEHSRFAAISSFGLSGTNAHMVFEEGPVTARPAHEEAAECTVLLSARDTTGLARQVERLRDLVARDAAGFDLAAAAEVLAAGREHFPYRLGWVVRNTDDLAGRLSTAEPVTHPTQATTPVVVALGDLKDVPLARLRQLAASYRGFARVLAEAAEQLPEGRWSPTQRALLSMLGSLAVLADSGIEPALLLTHGLGGRAARASHGESVGAALDAVAEPGEFVEPPDAAALSSVLPGDCTVVDLTPGTALSALLPAAVPFAEALCRLHLQGRALDWQAVLGRPRRRIELPVAPLSEEHCWPPIAHPRKETAEPEAPRPLLGSIDDIVLEMARDVLGEPGLALTDEFLGIGGNSLNGTQLIALINERFDVDLDVLDLFELPDLQAFANAVAAAAPEFSPTKTDTRSAGEGPLSEQQLAVLAAMGNAQEPGACNRPAALLLDGDADPDVLADLLTSLVRKHSMLRASLRDTPDEPRQVIAPAETAKAGLEAAELVISGETELDRRRELLEQVNRMAAVPVSPYDDPPVRYQLIDVRFPDRTRQVLLVVFHQLFVDEWGWHKVFEELIEGPAATPAPQRQYFDYVHAQRRLLSDDAESLTAFWTGYLAGSRYTPLPADTSHEGGLSLAASRTTDPQLTIPAGTADSLREFARRERSTLHMVMLAAWVALLWDIVKEPEVTVAVMAAGRAPEDEPLVGNFANTLVLRAGVRPDESFSDLLAVVREMTLLTFSHQHLPADRIGRIAKRGTAPLASTTFTFSGTPVGPTSRLGDDGPGVELLELTPVSSSSPLNLTVLVHSQEIRLNLHFAEESFTRETVQVWLKNYSALLRRVALLGHGIAVSDLVNSGIAERALIAPRADSDQVTRDSQGAGVHLSPRHR
ncbi:hypothetical protein SD37_10465 [Amycolatopsis orientalis]|uniref:Uncharacterized protein n=1 Tax=Amycolatopsis orientalis TaxID=31958 RepID=A0A193BV19_AMYOR|nr:beta-ketoacyl synthase N-terminal-like domain-containing protein [Amycolatopsis orientalis]ANN16020.1 hypothetical protein SD37_10465 [Amycolatopsis orientalis]